MPKSLTKVPAAVLGFQAAQAAITTNLNTGIGLVGYDGIYTKVVVGDLIQAMLAAKVAAKLAAVLPAYTTNVPGSVINVNPVTPKTGDLKTVKPSLDPTGSVISGQYEIHIYVGGWQKIFPRV